MCHITWIPAHPIYGAVSMRRYWQALDESTREEDGFTIRTVLRPTDVTAPPGIKGKFLRCWQRNFGYPATIRRNFSGDIAHVLDHSWADMLKHVPCGVIKVVTVHDLIPLTFPGELTSAQAARFRSWVEYLKVADAIIAVSDHTKGETERLLGIPSEKIRVVRNGVAMPTAGSARGLSDLPPADAGVISVGCIGSTIERKNLGVLPEAFARASAKSGSRFRLVRVGSPLPDSLACKLRDSLGHRGLVELGYLCDAEVGQFYESVDVVVVPSLYEGFGLPVLEAMAHGVPVISSNATSLPEVGGDVALYFDPHSAEELAERLVELSRTGVTPEWKERALARAERFSWRASLDGFFEVYQTELERAAQMRSNGFRDVALR